jgi:hypothetical protein
MRGRSSFGAGAYVVRYAWWSPIVPAIVGAALITGFVLQKPPDPGSGAWQWAMFGARWLMPVVGLGLVVLALVYLRRVVRGSVAFAAARRGVYWCPSGRRGQWFSWDDVSAIEFHPAEGNSTGRGAVALRGYAPPGEAAPRLVSSRLGGWRIGRRKLLKTLRRFAPHVRIIA